MVARREDAFVLCVVVCGGRRHKTQELNFQNFGFRIPDSKKKARVKKTPGFSPFDTSRQQRRRQRRPKNKHST
jgi:hypothetical protein